MKIGIIALLLSLGIILMNIIPGSVVVGVASGQTVVKNVGANTTNASEYLKGVANRIMLLLGIGAGVLVAVLWVWKVVIPLASADPNRKAEAKDNIKDLAIATLIIAMAVGGMIWLIFRWIAGV